MDPSGRESALQATFLIVAHNHPGHLARLAKALEAPWSTVLINVDAKVDDRPFRDLCAGMSHVHFVDAAERTSVLWGGMGLTKSALRMMRHALARFPSDRLCMLSGVDYVLKPMDHVRHVLSSDREFVRIDRELHYGRRSVHDDFITLRHRNDVRLLNPRSSPSRQLRRLAMPFAHRVGRAPPPVAKVLHGSGWWCITRPTAEWILDYVERHAGFCDWLHGVNCPDEIFMQTLVEMSPRRDFIGQNYASVAAHVPDGHLHGVHFIRWGEASSSPKTLDLDDFDAIAAEPMALFGRKIDPAVSEALLDRLDDLRREADSGICRAEGGGRRNATA